jgi:hypothetical protein
MLLKDPVLPVLFIAFLPGRAGIADKETGERPVRYYQDRVRARHQAFFSAWVMRVFIASFIKFTVQPVPCDLERHDKKEEGYNIDAGPEHGGTGI